MPSSTLTPALQQLLKDYQAMYDLVSAADAGSIIEVKTKEVIQLLEPIVKRAHSVQLELEDFKTLAEKSKSLSDFILKEKARNPMIPDELVNQVATIDSEVNNIQNILKSADTATTTKRPWYWWIYKLFGRN